MKNLLLLLLLFTYPAISQDTTTYEKKVRYWNSQVGSHSLGNMPAKTFSRAFNALANAMTSRVPFLTQSQLRAGMADSARVVYINEGLRSGMFRYNSTNTTSADDSAMVLRYGARRYEREYEVLRPEYFGANPNDMLDDWAAFQKTLNYVPNKGAKVVLSAGTYFSTRPLVAKKLNAEIDGTGAKDFRLTVEGLGKGVTNIQGTGDYLVGKNLFDFPFKPDESTLWWDSYITLNDFSIHAGKAARCIFIVKARNVDIFRCKIDRGSVACLELGDIGGGNTGDNFAAYVHGNYFSGATDNGGQNPACMIINSRFAEVYNNVSDGGRNALETTLDQMYIGGNTFEGFKFAGIYGKGTGGGGSKIIGNTMRPYSGFDPNGIFNGELNGIYIESEFGGMGSNTISANQIFVMDPAELDLVVTPNSVTSSLIPSPHSVNLITQAVSGATGNVMGINSTTNKIQIHVLTGTFNTVNDITQAGTGGLFRITSKVTNTSYAISLLGVSGFNIVSNNRLENGTYIVRSASNGNNISFNDMAGKRNGFLLSNNAQVIGNRLNFAGGSNYVTANRTSGDIMFDLNRHNGILTGIAPRGEARWVGGASPDGGTTPVIADVDLFAKNGIWTYDGSLHTPTSFGGLLNIASNTPDGDADNSVSSWNSQMFFANDGEIYYRNRVYSYGTYSSYRTLLTSNNKVAAVPNASTAAVAPTQAEFNALVASYNDLLTKMRASGLLTP